MDMKKVIVIGSPGAGKSTFARKIHEITSLPLHYLDMIWHNADRTNIPPDEFDRELSKIVAQPKWIIDGNYLRTMEIRLKECDTCFLLDYPLDTCIEGARNRIGKQRADMPWTESEFDPEFMEYIMDFPAKQLPLVYELLDKYSGKNIVIFHSRNESDEYIAMLEGKKNVP